jgi:hypothetical protein
MHSHHVNHGAKNVGPRSLIASTHPNGLDGRIPVMRRRILALTILTFTAAIALADHHQPASPLRQLDFMAGAWKCSGDVFATPMGPGRKSVGTADIKWGHDGRWLSFTYAEKKTEVAPMPVTFSGFIGYDAEIKQYVLGGVDSFGGYSTAGSNGVSDDAIVFVGPWHMGTMTANGRDTFTKSGRELVHSGEVEMDGKWVKYAQETCVK